ncbi:TPA: hypothetical protein ACOEGY_003449 [Enterobacter bugandensis]|uniref:hypothetical protein n=1 Tax=Enterobacter bugandensis TaxID=881260 RepID=UPI0020042A6C|nr:hypothetical protein [Enterobacter bugandensis]MCK7087874.1 hypothetical protein [Enterobacter bugandensis]MCK7158649.1 hypothetical protein [Enterobacter bugandensis]HCM9242780.1 hypothetical protein [Enterobacter bugandensis]HCM9446195.1 hypothetical protein [Enterobacter bugandensis]
MSNIDKQAGEGDVSPKTYYIHPMAFGGTQNPGYGHVPVVHADDFEKQRAKLEAAEKRIAELESADKRIERALSLLSDATTENVWEIIGRLKVVISGDYRSEAEIAAAVKGE